MSQVAVREGVQSVHTGDSRIWAIDVSAVTTSPSVAGSGARVYDITAGVAEVTTAFVTSGTLTASGTNVVFPTIAGWVSGHRYRVDGTFADGSGNTFVRSIFVQVDF